jgi:hypothetical protein
VRKNGAFKKIEELRSFADFRGWGGGSVSGSRYEIGAFRRGGGLSYRRALSRAVRSACAASRN